MKQHCAVSHALCMCLFHHSTAKMTNPWTVFVFIHFGLATSSVPTLHWFPAFSCCSAWVLGVWACYYRNQQKDNGKERRERCLHADGGGSKLVVLPPLIGCRLSNPTHPTVSCSSSFLLQNPWLLLLLLLLLALSPSLYLCPYRVIVRDAVIHV